MLKLEILALGPYILKKREMQEILNLAKKLKFQKKKKFVLK